ncbi:MAG: 16S rRNA (cytosine(967)-C(5))-methyltransferase RsmB [Pseudomonadota bacterium]
MNDYLDAVQSLMGVTHEGRSLDAALKSGASPLCKQICYGVLRHHEALDHDLERLLRKPLRKKDSDVKTLLLIGLYGLAHLRQPDHAIVNLAVETTRHLKKDWASGLVNGVLRQQIRSQKTAGATEDIPMLPSWLARQINSDWPDDATAVSSALSAAPPMTLRVNTRRTTREQMLSALRQADVSCHPGSLSNDCIYLEVPRAVNDIPGFDQGLLSVQDEGAQMAVPLLQVSATTSVLDACAAPGGKTGQLAEKMGLPGTGQLTAVDISPSRIDMIKDNLTRLQLSAELIASDLTESSELTSDTFDRILLDAPCSAVGVIRRHPDIKMLRRPTDVAKLVETQHTLLASVWRLLKDGGLLLYTTCSILHAENDEVVGRFIEQHTDASVIPIDASWGIATEYGRQLLPTSSAHDGFYFSLIARVEGP